MVAVSGTVKRVSELSAKAKLPMEVRPAGKATLARAEQPSKALMSMEVRVAGRAMETREEQPKKAYLAMKVVPSGTVACPCASIGGCTAHKS